MKMKNKYAFVGAAVVSAFIGLTPLLASAGEVNVYSYRKPKLIDPMFEVFTEQTGIKVNSVFAKKGMLERLQSEGANSPADLVFTVDIGRLSDIQNAGLTQSVNAARFADDIPENYREPKGHWFGLTTRTRIIVTSKDRVKPGEITTYEQLTDPKWKGRICTRSGKHVYMVALTASMIAHHGEAEAKKWLAGLKSNLARKPQGNDRAQVKAIKEGVPKDEAEAAKKRANLYAKYIPMIAEFCTELAGKKKEPNYKKMLETEIETENKKAVKEEKEIGNK